MSKIKSEVRNILHVKQGIIAHQVNCRGELVSAVSESLSELYPQIVSPYMKLCKRSAAQELLGTTQLIPVDEELWVANMFAQDDHGRSVMHTDYEAFSKCLKGLYEIQMINQVTTYVPYMIGCGRYSLGEGNWTIVESLLNQYLDHDLTVICKLV